jgi:hypothetical protein
MIIVKERLSMFKKIYSALFGITVDEDLITVEAKCIRASFEALKREGFSDEQAMALVVAKLNRRAM